MKRLFTFLIASLLMIGLVNAVPSAPMPIAIKVIMANPSEAIGIDVIVRDITHPYTMILKTNEYAEAVNDWGNAAIKGSVGDDFEVEVAGKLVKTKMYDSGLGDGIVFVNLIDDTKDCPIDTTPYNTDTCPIKETIKEVPVEVIKYVDVIKEVPVEKIVYVDNTPEPKDWTNEYIISAFALLAVALGAYKGYYRLQIKKKKISSTGRISYVYATVFEKTSTGTKVTR